MFRYYSTQRPFGPGTFPQKDGRENVVNFDGKIYCEEVGREAWGYIEYPEPLKKQEIAAYELTPVKTGKETFANVEKYMTKHDFLPADKSKVRSFLRDVGAVSAIITRNEIRWKEKNGINGMTGRGNIGIQDNFR